MYSSLFHVASTDFPDSFSLSLSLVIRLYHPSLLVGLLEYILYSYRAVVDKFLMVVQHPHVHVKGSFGESH